MATSTGNAFTGAAGAELSTVSGWHYISGSANVMIDADGAGAYPAVAQIGRYYKDGFVSTADTDSVSLAFDLRAGADNYQFGPVARAQANGDGYLFAYSGPGSATPNVFSLYRYNGSSISVLNANAAAMALAAGSHSMKVECVGTGASVVVNCYVDSSLVYSYTDSSANRITAFGYRGLWTFGASSPTTGVMLNSISGADSAGAGAAPFALTGASALDGHIAQSAAPLGSTAASTSLTRTGTYTGTPTAIQSRVLRVSTGQPLPGFDWATRVASPSNNTFSYQLTNLPADEWWVEEFRDSANPSAVTSPGLLFGVGELILGAGQSNTEVLSMAGAGTLSPKARVFDLYRGGGQWTSPSVGAGAIAMINKLVDALGGNILVGFIQAAMSGSGLAQGAGLATPTSGGVARDWSVGGASTTQAPSPRARLVSAMTLLGQRPRTAIWGQGESDAMTAVGVSTYQASATGIFAFLRTMAATDATIYCALLGQSNDTMSTAANWDAVRQAQLAAVAADGNAYALSKQDLVCDANSPDMTAANFSIWGPRIGQKIARHWGFATYGDGPRIASLVAATSVDHDITIAHDGGTDIAPASPTQVSDILVKDGATVVTPVSFVRTAANKIRFTLASAPTGTVTVQSNYGKAPVQSGVVHDNTALALPLQASAPIAVGVASTQRTVTLTLKRRDASEGEVANLTGIKLAVYDEPTPDLRNAPRFRTANGATSSTGVLSITFQSALATGGQCGVSAQLADGRNFDIVGTVS